MSSHGASDSSMQKMMIIVGIALCVLTITLMITSRTLSIGSNDEFDALLHNAKMERIQPAGQIRTEAPVVSEEVVAALSGEEIAGGACAACHISGAAGAPKFDDKAEWDKRAELGLEALVASVVNGKGAMPAGGGSNHSEEEITRAVEYMTGLGNGGVVDTADAADTATEEAAVSTEAESTAAAEEPADANTAETAEASVTPAAEATDTAAVTATSASGVIAAMTPRIQTTVDQGVCAGCHTAGVAGAPKYDDTAEWASRAEQGYAALAQTVATGKGAMPPRGGSDLTDDELLIAVEYMVQKSK